MREPVLVGSILIGADELVAAMVKSRVPHMGELKNYTALGVVRRGVLLGGVVYHNYRGFDVMLGAAFDKVGWALPGTVRALLSYPFNELGCRRISAVAGRKNKKSRKLLTDLGFELEGTVKYGLDGIEDAMLYGLLKEKCKFHVDNKRSPAATAAA